MNDPFRGGFISIAHHRRTQTPWIQIEVNRDLYGTGDPAAHQVDETHGRRGAGEDLLRHRRVLGGGLGVRGSVGLFL
jgi:hypothetical protein